MQTRVIPLIVLGLAVVGVLWWLLAGLDGQPSNIIDQTPDGVKHTVPLEEIISGGPRKDGIPSIDNPIFTSVEQATEWLKDQSIGLALSTGQTNRFYPFPILVWHEIVNDTIEGQRVLVTYCPLCQSGIVFDPLVEGERVEFGTSGKLWQSNLVMYDRQTDSYWSQILGQAIVGLEAGEKLSSLPADQMRFGEWRKLFPEGQVLSRETGHIRDYQSDPYGDYYTTGGSIFSVRAKDDRLPDKTMVLGVVVNGQAKAYLSSDIEANNEVTDLVGGETITLRYDPDLQVVRMFDQDGDRISLFPSLWFSWVAAHPDTMLYSDEAVSSWPDNIELTLEDYSGNQIKLSDFAGQPVVINSWASWCPFCVKELPDFVEAQTEFGDSVTIIAINRTGSGTESSNKARKFTDDMGISLDLIYLLDQEDLFYKNIGGFAMPETIFINSSGETVFHKRGVMSLEEVTERIKDII